MRIAIGSLMQETNTLVPFRTTVETFESFYLHRGTGMLTGYGAARVEVPAFLSVFAAAGAEVVPLVGGYAGASGIVTRAAFDELVSEMTDRLAAAGYDAPEARVCCSRFRRSCQFLRSLRRQPRANTESGLPGFRSMWQLKAGRTVAVRGQLRHNYLLCGGTC